VLARAARQSQYKAAYQIGNTSSSNFGDIDAGMVDMTSNDLETKVEVIHFGANRFLIYNFLYAVNSSLTFALGPTVYPLHSVQTADDRRTQH